MKINKKTCTLIGIHVLLVAGITAGYVSIYKHFKKTKLDVNSLSF